LAVIENEFGETDVDKEVLVAREHSDEIVVEVKNGCICCTVRGDLVESLRNIYKKTGGKLDGVIIETTGLADPAPVAQTFFVEEDIAKLFQIDAIITIVDAKHIVQHLDEEKPDGVENEAVEQLAFADRVFVNKVDLVDADKLKEVEKRIRGINKYAKLVHSEFKTKAPEMKEILGIRAFDLDRVKDMEPNFLNTDEEHIHDNRVTSVGFTLGADQQIELYKLQDWISTLIQDWNLDLFRYKGVIAVKGRPNKFVFQGVHMLFDGDFAGAWGDAERKSVFCFIGKNLNKMNLRENFMKCVAAKLRWDVNKRVQANVRDGFAPGTIIQTWDSGNAYRIRLDTGVEVWAPVDDDKFVKEL
jgi:G3E family GTPase